MNEQELEQLVVKLVADVGAYVDGMRKAEEAAKKSEEELSKSALAVESFSFKLNVLGHSIEHVGGRFERAFGGMSRDIMHAWEEAEGIGIRLGATLEANGRNVEEVRSQYEEFALTLQKTTTAEDDYVLSLLASAEGYQLSGDAAQKAVKDALALAKATGTGAEGALRLTTAMAEGDTERAQMFSRMIPALRGVKNEQEFVERFGKLVEAGFVAQGREAETAAGKIKQFENDLGNFKEELGKTMSEGLAPLVEEGKRFVAFLQRQGDGTKKAIAATIGLGAALGTVFATLGTGILVWNTLIKTAVDYTATVVRATAAIIAQNAAMTATIVTAGLVVVALGVVLATVTGLTQAWVDYQEAVERSNELDRKVAANFAADVTSFEKDRLEREKQGLENQIKDLESRVRDPGKAVGPVGSAVPIFGAAEALIAREQNKPIQKDLDETRARAAAVEEQLKKFTKAAVEMVPRAAYEEIDKLNESLASQIRTFGMGETEARLYTLALKNAGKSGEDFTDALAGAQAMTKELKRLKDEAAEIEKIFRDVDEVWSEAEKTLKDIQTPQEKYNDQLFSLNNQLYQGALTQDQYNRAVAKAQEELKKAGDKARQTKSEIQALDAMLSGGTRSRQFLASHILNVGVGTRQGKSVSDATRDRLLQQVVDNTLQLATNTVAIVEARF